MAPTLSASSAVELGEVDLPEGILVIVHPGLGRCWRHDEAPTSPREKDPEQWNLRLVGRDAEAAGKAYDREFDSRFLAGFRTGVRRYRVADLCRVKGLFTAGFRAEGFFAVAFFAAAFRVEVFFAVVAFFATVFRVDVFFTFAEMAFLAGAVAPPVSAFVQRWM
ncbi:hypothetical protein [Myxococcus qinghaiensis]|uniref:hypothetical protein n=1 Tax=Myxococcus qinghaiensis TaxID=2906758 RepID=UPI0020A709E3|nr:hypothetical protein [Myxococcus qinghaiensis]MCP3166760.1 hypothetical protein [Myxococcus qinghaiensis]